MFRPVSCWPASGGTRPEEMGLNEDKFASPACAADEADDVYMGFASKAEIAACLRDLDAGKIDHARLEAFLPRVKDELLYAELKKRLALLG